MTYEFSNCFGYAYWNLGIIASEKCIDTKDKEEIDLRFSEVKSIDEADAIVAYIVHGGVDYHHAAHIAVVDKDNRGFVNHRAGIREPIVHETVDEAFAFYIQYSDPSKGSYYRLAYLKIK
jgi:hypothetical protein